MAAAGRLPAITRPSVRPGSDDRLWARVARTRRLPVSYDCSIMRVVYATLVRDLCSTAASTSGPGGARPASS